jgi:hypothetical protein
VTLRFDNLRGAGWRLVQWWNEFFFTPQSPTPVALYRILYGLLITADVAMLHGDWLTWYGVNGFVRLETLQKQSPRGSLGFFDIMPQDDTWIRAFFWVFLLFAVLLTVGFLSRFSSVIVFLCVTSIFRRNPHIIHGGDTLLRATGFLLMFAPTDAALSIDRLWRIWRGKEGADIQPCRPWAQRMIQIQTALLYVSTFSWKMLGSDWRDGTALYYTTRLAQFQRFPTPALENGILLKLATWSALFVEFAVGVLVWIRKLRYWVLLAGVCLHLSIEYSMNIVLFQWIIMAGYVTFIDPADLSRAWGWLRRRVAGRLGNPVDVLYDGSSVRSARLANVLRAIDIFGRLRFVERHSLEVRTTWPALSGRRGETSVLIGANGSLLEGFSGLVAISRLVPLLWWLAPAALVSGSWRQPLGAVKAAK